MLTIHGKAYRHCDGLQRREFLTAGALAFGGLTLADLLRAEAARGTGASEKKSSTSESGITDLRFPMNWVIYAQASQHRISLCTSVYRYVFVISHYHDLVDIRVTVFGIRQARS